MELILLGLGHIIFVGLSLIQIIQTTFFAAIEAGALVQSHDGGKTWIDRNEQGPYDTHTLATHPRAPKRPYSSAGDGYFESFDYGESWISPMKGLRHSYLNGLAIDSGNPEVVIVSAARGPGEAYSAENGESYAYRKDEDSKKWKVVSNGLPEPHGSTTMPLFPICRFQGNSTVSTIVVYSYQLIQAIHGRN